MNSITFSSFLLFLIISISYCKNFQRNPIILVTKGIIEKENFLSISLYWYIRNFTEGDQFYIRASNWKKNYTGYFTIEARTGIYDAPHAAVGNDDTIDQFCLAAYSRDGELKNDIPCQSKVQWMYDRKDAWNYLSLPDLIIPGTHHSAAYAKSDYESLNQQDLISRWILCQTKSIKSQLMDGIRYLDLRPSFLYEDGEMKYIITHHTFRLMSMDEVVKQINEFMEISKDIVIVSFKEFYAGFELNDNHRRFIQYLEHSFEKHAHPRGNWRQILKEFWEADKRLILSYDDPLYETSNLMWPPIIQWWSDAQTINRLHSQFAKYYQNKRFPSSAPHAAMVELTHSFTTIAQDIFRRDMSLRHWAERVGRYIPRWYIEEWGKHANIIAVDFYQTSGIVDLAIQLTEKRLGEILFIN